MSNTPSVMKPAGWSLAAASLAALYAMTCGALALIGWTFDIHRLTDWRGDGISMFPNTAVCAVFSGLALLLLNRNSRPGGLVVIRSLAGVVALLGGLTLLQHIFAIDLGIDRLLLDRPWGQRAAAAPMRMGPPASLSFLMIGAALLLQTTAHASRRASSALAVVVAAIATLSLNGYLYGAQQMYTIPRLTGIAMQSASVLLLLAIGVIASAPDREPMRALLHHGAAGTLARRALPMIVVVAVSLGAVRVWLQVHGYVDTAFGTAMRTVVEMGLLTGLLWWAVKMVRAHEEALHARENELREQSRRKDEFLAMLAHELRNPLAPLRNGVETLGLIGGDAHMLDQIRGMMHRQITHMVRLVDDLLDASRISRDKLQLRTERVELAVVVHEALQACRPQAQSCDLRLDVSLPEDDPIYLDGDPVRLVQVLCNLVGNAIKYSDPGDRVLLAVERDDTNTAVILVKDTGIGIPPEMLDTVFEMFTQVDRSLERMRGGLGIGLTLARRLIEMHGGTLTARSEGSGHGSEFIARLPVLPPEPQSAQYVPARQSAASGYSA